MRPRRERCSSLAVPTYLYISSRDAVDNPRALPAESGRRNYQPPAISHAARPGPGLRGKKCFQRIVGWMKEKEKEGEGTFPRLNTNPIASIADDRNVRRLLLLSRYQSRAIEIFVEIFT